MVQSAVDIWTVADAKDELAIRGEIDFHSSEDLRKAIWRHFEAGRKNLRLMLEGVDFIDSTGLSVLLDAVKMARARGGGITLVRPTRQLLRVLSVSGFAPFFGLDLHDGHSREDQAQEPAEDEGLQTETFEAEARPENIGNLRQCVIGFAKKLPFTKQELDDIKLAVGEATTNALRYGCPTGREIVRITCTRKGRRFSVQVSDPGPGFDPDKVPPVTGDELTEGGRGIYFMRCLMDEVNFTFTGGGTTVELVKCIPERTAETPHDLAAATN
ncbi:MAG: anti-sigma factor antagonist [Armatimonadetes bacterium]|nr:anti-sigma factor antagonist [Armatimonadota bacterium]